MVSECILVPLTIIYNDEYLVVVDKPAGLLVHKSAIDKHETRFLLQQLRDQLGEFVFPVHRLDKPTSGVILFAKSAEMAAVLQAQMEFKAEAAQDDESRQSIKEYLLVCRGYTPDKGIIDHPLKPINDFKQRRRKKPSLDKAPQQNTQKPAQEAITHYQRLATYELNAKIDRYPTSRFSLLKARLLTGRKHQIRRHCKHISHPIIGCPRYGKSTYNRYFADSLAVNRLLLHAYRLTLSHPVTHQELTFRAPLSGSFSALIESFDWQAAVDCA